MYTGHMTNVATFFNIHERETPRACTGSAHVGRKNSERCSDSDEREANVDSEGHLDSLYISLDGRELLPRKKSEL